MEASRAQAPGWQVRAAVTTPVAAEAVSGAVLRTAGTATSELCLLLRTSVDKRRLAPHPVIAEAASRGVRIRVVQEFHAGDPAQGLAAAGADVRLTPRISSPMLIADRRVALVLPTLEASAPAVAVGRSVVLSVLVEHFELLWETAPDAQVRGAGGPALGPRDGEILGLLAAGLTDDAVAAHVGSSARTVRRRVAGLMRQAGARTRFQAGVEAARRGWV